MVAQDFLAEEAAGELLAMPDEELDRLLETRVLALQGDPSLSLEASFEPAPTALESLTAPPWLEKTVEEMVNTAIRQTYSVACSKDPNYKKLRDELVASLGIGGTAAVIALAGFLTATIGLAAALASVIATIIVKKILGPALAAGHETMCQELKDHLPA